MTLRQLQCLRLAADGYTTDQIAARIHLSPCSVKNDLRRARDHLRASNTPHAVAIAMRRGILPGLPPHARSTGTGWPEEDA